MKKQFLTLLTVLAGLLLGGCYPEGAEYLEDVDVVITNYDETYDFTTKMTYAMPDQIVKITGDLTQGDAPSYIPQVYATQILAMIDANMTSLGWTKVTLDQTPDLLLAPASWETTTIYYYYDYWSYWYGGYYGWYYPYGGYYSSSYTTGTMIMTLIDPNNLSTNGNPTVAWTGAINGLLSYSFSANRVKKAIDQAFIQSPYLTKN